jgi:hypothetical protein
MGKQNYTPSPRIKSVFDDLELYLNFCREFGYRYDEADLTNWKSYAFQQFNKHQQGKPAKDMWAIDSKKPSRDK